jgi:hypothetical protein
LNVRRAIRSIERRYTVVLVGSRDGAGSEDDSAAEPDGETDVVAAVEVLDVVARKGAARIRRSVGEVSAD